MVPKWLERILQILFFALLGAVIGLFNGTVAWHIIAALVLLGFILLLEMIWDYWMRSLGARFFTKKV